MTDYSVVYVLPFLGILALMLLLWTGWRTCYKGMYRQGKCDHPEIIEGYNLMKAKDTFEIEHEGSDDKVNDDKSKENDEKHPITATEVSSKSTKLHQSIEASITDTIQPVKKKPPDLKQPKNDTEQDEVTKEESLYTCTECGNIFSDETDLVIHCEKQHMTRCPECGNLFSSTTDMKMHFEVVHTEKPKEQRKYKRKKDEEKASETLRKRKDNFQMNLHGAPKIERKKKEDSFQRKEEDRKSKKEKSVSTERIIGRRKERNQDSVIEICEAPKVAIKSTEKRKDTEDRKSVIGTKREDPKIGQSNIKKFKKIVLPQDMVKLIKQLPKAEKNDESTKIALIAGNTSSNIISATHLLIPSQRTDDNSEERRVLAKNNISIIGHIIITKNKELSSVILHNQRRYQKYLPEALLIIVNEENQSVEHLQLNDRGLDEIRRCDIKRNIIHHHKGKTKIMTQVSHLLFDPKMTLTIKKLK